MATKDENKCKYGLTALTYTYVTYVTFFMLNEHVCQIIIMSVFCIQAEKIDFFFTKKY